MSPRLAAQQHSPAPMPYRDARLPVEVRVRDLLRRMTPEEKFWQLYMSPGDLADSTLLAHGVFGLQVPVPGGDSVADAARRHAERINAIQRFLVGRTRLGIPMIPFEEAVHGLARGGATTFPQAIALAATWDTELVGRVASAIADETRSRGVRQVLSPVVNIASDPRWGRVEETYGEDPLLASRMASAFVLPFEQRGVVATPKHFVANVADGGRDSWPADYADRRLIETYFPPFRAAFAAGARSVMTAYNSVNGVPATQNARLLTDRLRRQWHFGGIVISDAAATGGPTVLQMTEPSTPHAAADAWRAGLDVVFQSSVPQYRPYKAAIDSGLVPIRVIDSAVAHVLRLKFALGLFERPYVDEDGVAALNRSPAHAGLARDAAARAIVLLKNAGALPLGRHDSIAIIGTDAAEARMGGYTAPSARGVSLLDALRSRLGDDAVRYVAGPGRLAPDFATVPASALSNADRSGLVGEYFAAPGTDGTPAMTRTDTTMDFRWTLGPPRGLPRGWYAARWHGTITAPASGVRRLGVDGNDGWRLWIDGALLLDRWSPVSSGASLADVGLAPGSRHDVRLEFHDVRGPAKLRLVWDDGSLPDPRAAIDSAVTLARGSRVAIVVAGVEEGEFRDRARLTLPGRQEALIRAVAATGTPTVVVIVGGSAVVMSHWVDSVAAVVDAWYPGEQGGNAIADVLLGDVNPAGRLPISFAMEEGQLPYTYDHEPTGRGDDYLDLAGKPRFPFGYGLSYTTFAYDSLAVTPDTVGAAASATVRCRVTNTGSRAGDDVVQLYINDQVASVARPVIQLAGFSRVHLEPHASTVVTFSLGPEQLAMVNARLQRVVEPGDFTVMIGASSEDIRLRGVLTVR